MEALGGEDVLDLARADAEGERAEGAVGAGVGVAADDRLAGLGVAQLRADHVDDALALGVDVVEADAELLGVRAHRLDLLAGDLVLDREGAVGGGDVVVDGGDRKVGAAHGALGEAEALERLGGGDLVDEVEVDVDQSGLARLLLDEMGIPDFLEHRLGGHRSCPQVGVGRRGGSLARHGARAHCTESPDGRPGYDSHGSHSRCAWMELHQLEYLRAVVRTGSVTRAAALVNVSQPSVSKQI
jgi:hypothetical protein